MTQEHPLTCGNPKRHADGLHTDGEGVLVVWERGLVCPYCGWRQPSVKEAFAAMRAAGGDAWDDIDDPEAFLRELRGETAMWPAPIPVAERLPPDDPDCPGSMSVMALCWSVDDSAWMTGHYNHDAKCWDVLDGWDRSITHWLPIPPAP